MLGAELHIRPAVERDVPVLLGLIKDLAHYEQLAHQVEATEDGLRRALFGPQPAAEALVAFVDAEPAGFALFFQNFSTFVGRPGLYLEDLFVRPEFRGRGIGKRLLATLARIAVDRNYGRMEWAVLDWNELALGVYRRVGAQPLEDWTVHRLTGEALRKLSNMTDG